MVESKSQIDTSTSTDYEPQPQDEVDELCKIMANCRIFESKGKQRKQEDPAHRDELIDDLYQLIRDLAESHQKLSQKVTYLRTFAKTSRISLHWKYQIYAKKNRAKLAVELVTSGIKEYIRKHEFLKRELITVSYVQEGEWAAIRLVLPSTIGQRDFRSHMLNIVRNSGNEEHTLTTHRPRTTPQLYCTEDVAVFSRGTLEHVTQSLLQEFNLFEAENLQ